MSWIAQRAVSRGARLSLVFFWVATAPAVAQRPSSEVLGSWQLNIDCTGIPEPYATATSFLVLEEDPATGDVYASIPRCGTISTLDAIREIDCLSEETPPVLVAGRGSTELLIPPDGSFPAVAIFPEPFPFLLVGCSEVALISTQVGYELHFSHIAGRPVSFMDGLVTSTDLQMEDTHGDVCFSAPRAVCPMTMRRNEVGVGSDVEVQPILGVRVAFAEVLAPGTVAVTPLTELNATLPPGFSTANGAVDVLLDVSTTAAFAGTVAVCVRYYDANRDGFIDGTSPPVPEERIRILHEEASGFVDRTSRVDTAADEVCATTSDLSRFTLRAKTTPAAPVVRRGIAIRGRSPAPGWPGRVPRRLAGG
jgi:hypothetical protein